MILKVLYKMWVFENPCKYISTNRYFMAVQKEVI